MTIARVSEADLGWVVEVLGRRRAALVPHAPVFWSPSPHAERYHRDFLRRLLISGAAEGYRTETGVLIAMRTERGWNIDDAWVADDQWAEGGDAHALWAEFAGRHSGDEVGMVCPAYEPVRCAFAARQGLVVTHTW